MKKLTVITLIIVLALSLVACADKAQEKGDLQNQTGSQVTGENSTQIPNPFVDCKTIEDAEKIAGFNITIPDNMPKGYSQSSIQAIENDMIQVFFKNGDNEILIRKGMGSEDISGDYNTYQENNAMTVGALQVATRGNNGEISVATWIDGKYTFSISINPDTIGLDSTTISDMISNIQ